jgi:hypothetical protein
MGTTDISVYDLLCSSDNPSILILVFPNTSDPSSPTWTEATENTSQQSLNEKLNSMWEEIGKNSEDVAEFEKSQFSQKRYVIAFMPGTYKDINIVLNYYCSAIGLGKNPSDVMLNNSTIEVPPFLGNGELGALDNFWRSAENMEIVAPDEHQMKWAVSQASPMRNMTITTSEFWFFDIFKKNDDTYPSVYASGGYIADTTINGKVNFGGQQQFMTSNCEFQSVPEGGAWNIIHATSTLDTNVVPTGTGDLHTYIPVRRTIPPKPHLYVSDDNNILLLNNENYTIHMVNETHTITEINEFLSQPNVAVVFIPGYYKFNTSLHVTNNNTTILSVGLATLENTGTEPALMIDSGLRDVVIAGLTVQAGPNSSSALIKVGVTTPTNPVELEDGVFTVTLYDIFCRVGGPSLAPNDGNAVTTMLEINENNVIVDHTWLWRADHTSDVNQRSGLGVENAVCDHALVVNGHYVTINGLHAEHTLKDIVIWNGWYGCVNMLQCELPYDVSGNWDYSGLRITGEYFRGTGLGVYSFFANKHSSDTICTSAIVVDEGVKQCTLSKCFTRFLDIENGHGEITYIVNNVGPTSDKTESTEPSYIDYTRRDGDPGDVPGDIKGWSAFTIVLTMLIVMIILWFLYRLFIHRLFSRD